MQTTQTVETSSRPRRVLAALGFGALCFGVGALGALTMRGRGRPGGLWFRSLEKSPLQPPDRVFAPVWTVLYAAIAYSGYKIWKAPASPERTRALALWGAQLALNGAWTPIFFGARRPVAALADLLALDAAATAYALSAAKVDRPAAVSVAPYLGWIGFATYLNSHIVASNPRARLTP